MSKVPVDKPQMMKWTKSTLNDLNGLLTNQFRNLYVRSLDRKKKPYSDIVFLLSEIFRNYKLMFIRLTN